jgi:hypothetical protein
MFIKYNVEIKNEIIIQDIQRLTNLIFKLLPNREENKEWKPALQNLILEITGMKRLIEEYQSDFLILLCKMESLLVLDGEDDFLHFRRTIFECLNLLTKIKNDLRGKNDGLFKSDET